MSIRKNDVFLHCMIFDLRKMCIQYLTEQLSMNFSEIVAFFMYDADRIITVNVSCSFTEIEDVISLLWYDWKNILSLLLHLLDFYAYHVKRHRIEMHETYLQHYPKKRLTLFSYCLAAPSFEDYFQTANRKFGNCILKQHRNQHTRSFMNYNSFSWYQS